MQSIKVFRIEIRTNDYTSDVLCGMVTKLSIAHRIVHIGNGMVVVGDLSTSFCLQDGELNLLGDNGEVLLSGRVLNQGNTGDPSFGRKVVQVEVVLIPEYGMCGLLELFIIY